MPGSLFWVVPLERLINAFKNSIAGFRYLVRHEEAFRQECVLFILAVPLAFLFAVSLEHFLLLVGLVVLIVIVEVLNTAVEAVCDVASPEFDDNIKIAKDCGSFAVLLACGVALLVWLLAFWNWAVG